MNAEIRFTVEGKPEPQGSIRNVGHRGGKAILTSDNPNLHAWREAVGYSARAARLTPGIMAHKDTPVRVDIEFHLERPPSAPKSRQSATVKPDLDKLCRAILDALTGILWQDDGQVTRINASKHYAPKPYASIIVEVLA